MLAYCQVDVTAYNVVPVYILALDNDWTAWDDKVSRFDMFFEHLAFGVSICFQDFVFVIYCLQALYCAARISVNVSAFRPQQLSLCWLWFSLTSPLSCFERCWPWSRFSFHFIFSNFYSLFFTLFLLSLTHSAVSHSGFVVSV